MNLKKKCENFPLLENFSVIQWKIVLSRSLKSDVNIELEKKCESVEFFMNFVEILKEFCEDCTVSQIYRFPKKYPKNPKKFEIAEVLQKDSRANC